MEGDAQDGSHLMLRVDVDGNFNAEMFSPATRTGMYSTLTFREDQEPGLRARVSVVLLWHVSSSFLFGATQTDLCG